MSSHAIGALRDSLRRPSLRTVIVAATSVVAVGWYLWPAVQNDHSAVAVITDGSWSAITDHVTTEVRVRGRAVSDLGTVSDWCALAASVPSLTIDADVGFVVIAIDTRGDCAGDPEVAALRAISDRSLAPVVVLDAAASAPSADVRTVPIEQLLGSADTRAMSCQWWEDCPQSGRVDVRNADGSLTDLGADRVARMVASAIG